MFSPDKDVAEAIQETEERVSQLEKRAFRMVIAILIIRMMEISNALKVRKLFDYHLKSSDNRRKDSFSSKITDHPADAGDPDDHV